MKSAVLFEPLSLVDDHEEDEEEIEGDGESLEPKYEGRDRAAVSSEFLRAGLFATKDRGQGS
jgi:hypothetical protein